MKHEVQKLISDLDGLAGTLKMRYLTVSGNIAQSYSASNNYYQVNGREADSVMRALDDFFQISESLNILLDGALNKELSTCTTKLENARAQLHEKDRDTVKTCDSLKLIHNNTFKLSEVAVIAQLRVESKIAQLNSSMSTEVASSQTLNELVDRVTRLERGLEEALSEISKLRASQGAAITASVVSASDASPRFFVSGKM